MPLRAMPNDLLLVILGFLAPHSPARLAISSTCMQLRTELGIVRRQQNDRKNVRLCHKRLKKSGGRVLSAQDVASGRGIFNQWAGKTMGEAYVRQLSAPNFHASPGYLRIVQLAQEHARLEGEYTMAHTDLNDELMSTQGCVAGHIQSIDDAIAGGHAYKMPDDGRHYKGEVRLLPTSRCFGCCFTKGIRLRFMKRVSSNPDTHTLVGIDRWTYPATPKGGMYPPDAQPCSLCDLSPREAEYAVVGHVVLEKETPPARAANERAAETDVQ